MPARSTADPSSATIEGSTAPSAPGATDAPDAAHSEPVRRAIDALDAAAPGPFLLHGDRARAHLVASRLAEHLGTRLERLPADTVGLTGDAVADLHSALRDAMHLRVRLMRKVFEGRVQQIKPVGPDPGPAARRLPPSQLELTLTTDEDVRTMRLEGAFAAAFHSTGARVGDVVQVDREVPIVSLRPGREPEGRVLEERDFVYHVRLGDRDRAYEPTPASPATSDAEADEVESEQRKRRPVAAGRPLIGTGRFGHVTPEAMRATDRWVDDQLGGKGTRLEAAVLLIEDADQLPEAALVALREAVRSPASPIVVLHSGSAEELNLWERRFDTTIRLS